MQVHFNENYVEVTNSRKQLFRNLYRRHGYIQRWYYQVVVKGDLSLHGVTKPLETTAQIEGKKRKDFGSSAFKIKPKIIR